MLVEEPGVKIVNTNRALNVILKLGACGSGLICSDLFKRFKRDSSVLECLDSFLSGSLGGEHHVCNVLCERLVTGSCALEYISGCVEVSVIVRDLFALFRAVACEYSLCFVLGSACLECPLEELVGLGVVCLFNDVGVLSGESRLEDVCSYRVCSLSERLGNGLIIYLVNTLGFNESLCGFGLAFKYLGNDCVNDSLIYGSADSILGKVCFLKSELFVSRVIRIHCYLLV